jgi:hypothetical protein
MRRMDTTYSACAVASKRYISTVSWFQRDPASRHRRTSRPTCVLFCIILVVRDGIVFTLPKRGRSCYDFSTRVSLCRAILLKGHSLFTL